MEKTLYIYRASAGSGKTFTLAVEYIKLLIANPRAYRHTLAVTFTNKATGEMKERIMSQLYGIAHALPASERYFSIIADTYPTMGEEEIRKRAKEALHMLLHDYGHFRVQTIDAFFQSILRGLAKELELSGNMEIMIDGEKLLADTVDSLIRRLSPESKEMQWLVEYIKEHLENGKSWNVPSAIKDFAKNILKEEYQERGDKLRHMIESSNGKVLEEYRDTLRKVQENTINDIKRVGEEFFELAQSYNLDVQHFAGKSTGLWSVFQKFRNGDIPPMSKTTEKCINDPSKVSSKLPQDQCLYIVQLINKVYTQHTKTLNNCAMSLKRFHQLRLLNSIADALHEDNMRENRFLLAETTYLLSRMIDNDTSFIFEKIGTEINHIFIDEFQDTSKLQWSCFKVLLYEVMSRGNFNLIVGDVKQSIYRWRNSDWNILNNIEAEFPKNTIGDYAGERLKSSDKSTKTINYRSARNIVEFNNALFKCATEIITENYANDLKERLTDLKKAYSDVEQGTNKREEKGYAEIRMLDCANKNKDGMYEASLAQLMETLDTLLNEKKLKPSDITILIRNNKDTEYIVEEFNNRFQQRYSIVSESAYKLSSSAALHILTTAMRNVSHPDDTLNTIELITYYYRYVKNREIEPSELYALKENTDSYLPAQYLEKRHTYVERPLNEITEQLICDFNLHGIEGETPYIYSFIDYTAQYIENGKCNITDFLQTWNDEISDKSIPVSEDNSVRIMTIHKSKGLEFHTVIIPFCFWKTTKEFHSTYKENLLWCQPHVDPYDKLPLLPIEYSSKMNDSIYSQEYNHETLFELVDNMNLLYVACTRASNNLFILSSTNTSADTTQLLLSRIIDNFPLQNTVYDSNNGVLTYGEIAGHEEKQEKQEESVNQNPFTMEEKRIEQRFLSYDNRLTSRQSHNLSRFLATDKEQIKESDYIDIGELLHEIMSHLITGEELERELARKQMEGLIATTEERNKISRLIRNALSHDNAKEWFSGKYTVINECSILHRDGEQKISRPDRVMIKDDKAIVVDFKFARERDKYKTQVEEYMQKLRLMGFKEVEGYLWYLYSNRIIPVHPTHEEQ